ncbi:o-succinylbenzoate synthase [Pantanalinema rosaneae CENA516]|uniref:o-succinylbenzoate synthase n=1 Tax=Pantanalinema rosaneae TaxID=1620701 RepID=UPI003D6EE6F1
MRWEFRPYRRVFRQPLPTHHGEWRDRTGIILRLTNDLGQVGYGEIAPLPWFGSETLEQALEFCHQLPPYLTTDLIHSIPATLPACQFGFESAWSAVTLDDRHLPLDCASSGLLPTGQAALTAWKPLWQQGYRTFKWKIGVGKLRDELDLFTQLVARLPSDCRLRLDANGGLTYDQTQRWLEQCHTHPIEFLEQPLPPDQLGLMQQLAANYATPIALDESISTLTHLQACYHHGWQGIYVIKPAIVGSPAQLRQFCQHHPIDAVFSSVFETAIGRLAGLHLAAEFGNRDRAMGYGTTHWFPDADSDADHLWQTLSPI